MTVCAHPVLAELPGGQAGALVARPGFVDPDMDRDAGIMGAIDRRQRRAPVDGGEPAGIAMGQHLDRLRGAAALPRLLDQPGAMPADRAADRDIGLGDLAGPGQRRGERGLRRRRPQCAAISPSAQRRLTAVGRVAASPAAARTDRRRRSGRRPSPAPCHRLRPRRSAGRRAPASSRIARAASSSVARRRRSTSSMRQPGLIDDLDRRRRSARQPDRPHRPAADIHLISPRRRPNVRAPGRRPRRAARAPPGRAARPR